MITVQSKNNLNEAIAFTHDILPQVSRTFDLAIKFLPNKLGQPVGLAYLLCRIADTFEDSAQLDPSTRQNKLENFALLLDNFENYDEAIIANLQNSFDNNLNKLAPNCSDDHPASIKLVQNMDQVLLAVDALPNSFKRHIFPRVQEMSRGMASYTVLAKGYPNNIAFLKDEEDWDNYCYYVAGTVGHMLTDIFSDYAGFGETTNNRLHDLGRSFGLGLQKVNVLKDAEIGRAHV
jgi:farnesyl-diphosphate farnesyltransferase